MSYIGGESIKNNNSKKSSIEQNNNNIYYISNKSLNKNTQNKNYKYNYSNNNNCKNNLKILKIKNEDNIKNINIKSIKTKKASISPASKSFCSPQKLKCETNYSINNKTNTYYVNGLNKNIMKNNINRSPDIRFIHFEKKDNYKKINNECNNEKKESFIQNISFEVNKNDLNVYNKKNKYIDHMNKNGYENQKINISEKTYSKENNNIKDQKSLITNNHSFKSIRNLSTKENKLKNQFSINKKYKCDIKIHNINDQAKENIRSFSCDNSFNKSNINKTKVFISEHIKAYDNLEYQLNRQKSFDKIHLKMQNSQNIQILQEEKLYQILVPIPPNEIDFICQFQIPSIDINKKIIKKNIISEKEISLNKENKTDYFKKQIKYNKKTNWSKINSSKKINFQHFNIEKFSLNYEQVSRKFKGEMQIENTDLNFERTPRNWNGLLQTKRNNPLSIERKKNKESILTENSVEKITINKAYNQNEILSNKNKKQNIDLNMINGKENEMILKQNEKFFIKGNKKNWNNAILQKRENNFLIKSARGNDKFELEENEEKNIINDDEIQKTLKRNIIVNIKKEIKNEIESSESSSQYDVLKKISHYNNNKYENIIKNSFEYNENDRKVIINNIHKYPKKLINKNYELKKNNNYSFYQKKEINNNLNLEFPEPEIEMNPQYINNKKNECTEYNYRESITNKKILINQIEKKISNKDNLDDENDIEGTETNIISDTNGNIEENQSHSQTLEFPTPSSNMRCEYREEIITLSPIYANKRKQNFEEDINNKNENEGINFMEEEYQNYFSNNENFEIQSSKLEEEKEIIPKERETNESDFDYNNLNSRNNFNGKRHKVQYIYKNKSKNSNKNNINRNNYEFNQNNINEHNIKCLNEKKSSSFTKEKNKNKDNDENFGQNQVNNRGINNNLKIYNSQKLVDNNKLNNLNEQDFQRSNGLSKSNIRKGEQNIKNTFGNSGQINIGNIILNNTLKRKNKNKKSNKFIDNEQNLIHHYEDKKKEISTTNENNNNNDQIKNNHLNSKIRILKK